MNVQLVLKPSSGISVYETEWLKGISEVYTGEFPLEPGDNVRSISIGIHVNQPGAHYVDGEIYYQVEGKRIVQRDRLILNKPIPPSETTGTILDSVTKYIEKLFEEIKDLAKSMGIINI